MVDPSLHLVGLRKVFGTVTAVAGIDLEVNRGEFVTLLGPSGCGKTTTLSLIAGFFPASDGDIILDGKSIADVPPFRRDIGIVFQDYALFPHMTVAENIAFGLRMRKVPKEDVAKRVTEALRLVKMSGFEARQPNQLSGGQKQRVALARALVIQPSILLLDEPLSNLDLKLREEMRIEIMGLQRQLGITTIFVTHDQSEALVMSDRVALMNNGRIEQFGPPSVVYERPATRFVAEFIGSMNFISGNVVSARNADGVGVVRSDGEVEIGVPIPADMGVGTCVHIAIRPERLLLSKTCPSDWRGFTLHGEIQQIVYLGARQEIHLKLAIGHNAIADIPNDGRSDAFAVGDTVFGMASAESCLVLYGD